LHIGIVLNSKDDENWEWVSGKKATKIDNPVWMVLLIVRQRCNLGELAESN
jgi:hypothetical protein